MSISILKVAHVIKLILIIAPIIKPSPMDQVYIASPGLEVGFTCTVEGGIGKFNKLEILWSGPVDLPNTTVIEVSSGVFTSNLTLTNVTANFSGIYKCTTRYNNSLCATNTSSNASLVLLGPPTLTNQTESPSRVDCGDNNTMLYFEFSGLPSLTNVQCTGPQGDIEMSDNVTLGVALDRMDNDIEFQVRLSINIAYVNNAHGGMYSCSASNSAGSITATILLQVLQPEKSGTVTNIKSFVMCSIALALRTL